MNTNRLLFVLLPVIFLASVVLTGCTDIHEMKHQSFITAVGLDRAEDNKIKVSLLELSFDKSNQGDSGQNSQGGQSKNAKVINATCGFFPDCMDRLQNKLSGRLTLNQVQYVLFGEKLLASGVMSYIDYFYHVAQMEQTVKLFATDQEIHEFLQNDGGTLLNRLIGGIEFHPSVFNVEMWEFAPKIYTQLHSGVLSSMAIRGDALNRNGLFLLKEDKLGMKLPIDDALLAHMLIGEGVKELTLSFPKEKIAYQVRNYSTKMRLTPKSVDLYVDVSGWAIYGREEENQKNQPKLSNLEKTISKKISGKLQEIMDQTQSKGIDFLGVGEKFRQKNWDTSEWETQMKKLNIGIHVDATVLSGKGVAVSE